jgi:hypothetical protein
MSRMSGYVPITCPVPPGGALCTGYADGKKIAVILRM